jgi:hypothetical protein
VVPDLRSDDGATSVMALLRASLVDEAEHHDQGVRATTKAAVQRRLEFVEAAVSSKPPRLEAWFKRALQT